MSLTSIPCPECGAKLKSAAGFAPGQTVSCPKCETDFTVREDADDGDEFEPKSRQPEADGEWSYKNSWIRYAVLGLLLAVLGVLGYMLYDKKQREGKDTAQGGDPQDAPHANPRLVGQPDPRLVPAEAGGGGVNPIGKKGKAGPVGETVKRRLVGNWGAKVGDDTFTVEYDADGTFSYAVEQEKKAIIRGRWKVTESVSVPGPTGAELALGMEWTADGKPPLKGTVTLSPDDTLSHPLLHGAAGDRAPAFTFKFSRQK